jgi:cytoskeletal protein RodZ
VSTLLRPVGPNPPGVYWVRRAVVLLVVVALVGGLAWWLSGRGGSGTTAAPEPSQSSTPTAEQTTPEATPTASATKTPSPSASASGTPACKDSQITVTASTDAASYAVGSTPRLRMRIQNTSQTACKRDVGAAQNELVITSGSARVWSSDDCNEGGAAQVVTLKPDQSYSVSVTWLGRVSKKGCPADQPLAEAGTYKLTGRNGDVTSDPATFALTAAP